MRFVLFISSFGALGVPILPFTYLLVNELPMNTLAGSHLLWVWIGCIVVMLASAFLLNLRAGGSDPIVWRVSGSAWTIVITLMLVIIIINRVGQ